ncbi:hypothetical protein PRIPAC_95028 [Pristionchus pacificus]|uniref:Uncharacterized protein n=1 Tax=Pristionchus pacificus TaxID=54126 RepID=A0A2A6B478_PRIPA|nr:hypothetical protein PRIPAC_95028 [Pristionchus pacificus]|eukprot:PDM60682.1 hypothetical protein PRIPAC_53951 [Pristionchus pacificus]
MLCFFLSLLLILSTQDSIPPDIIQSLLNTLPDLLPDNSTSLLIEETTVPSPITVSSNVLSNLSDIYPNRSTTLQLIERKIASSNAEEPFDIFSYLNSSEFDFIEYHIRRYLNHRFAPCFDFFRFTCDYDHIGNNSLAQLSEDFYNNIFLSTQPHANTQIDNDLDNLQKEGGNSTDFSSLEYSMALTERCASNQSCFADEFKLTYQVYNFLRLNSSLLLKAGFNESLTALLFYEGVRARVRVMQKMERRKENMTIILAKTRELAIEMAQGLLDKFNRTPWLHVTNIFNLPTFVQFSTTLQNMTLRTDLDEGFDFNNLGSALYTAKFSLLYATSQLSLQLRREGRTELLFRVTHSLQYVTGNVNEGIVLNAPSFFPLILNSRQESLLGSLGTSIARELVYRFVNSKYTKRSEEYAMEYDGISEHFHASCEIFSEKNCSLMRSQIQEYASDLEGLSLAYELMRKSMDYDDLHKQPYSDLPFTSEQLFFVAYSVSLCRDYQKLSTQVTGNCLL